MSMVKLIMHNRSIYIYIYRYSKYIRFDNFGNRPVYPKGKDTVSLCHHCSGVNLLLVSGRVFFTDIREIKQCKRVVVLRDIQCMELRLVSYFMTPVRPPPTNMFGKN